jgi:hypothetical protein
MKENIKVRIMAKCRNGGECRGTLGCALGICAQEVDEHIDEWAEEHGWE